MFVFLDDRITDIYSLQHTRVEAHGDLFNVVSESMPEDARILKSFANKADAETFVTRIQNALSPIEGTQILDLRTIPDESQ